MCRNAVPASAGTGTDIPVNFGGSSSPVAEVGSSSASTTVALQPTLRTALGFRSAVVESSLRRALQLTLSAAGMAAARKLRQTGFTGDVADQVLASLPLPEPALLPAGVPSLPTSMPEAAVTDPSTQVTAAPPEGPSPTLQAPPTAAQAPSPAAGEPLICQAATWVPATSPHRFWGMNSAWKLGLQEFKKGAGVVLCDQPLSPPPDPPSFSTTLPYEIPQVSST